MSDQIRLGFRGGLYLNSILLDIQYYTDYKILFGRVNQMAATISQCNLLSIVFDTVSQQAMLLSVVFQFHPINLSMNTLIINITLTIKLYTVILHLLM